MKMLCRVLVYGTIAAAGGKFRKDEGEPNRHPISDILRTRPAFSARGILFH
jgi:hypothetical protein